MSAKRSQGEERVIDSPTKEPAWDSWGTEVRKIVLGTLGSDAEEGRLKVKGLPDLAGRFPRLTHLYLWGVEGLKRLAELPKGLVCLEVRGCADLQNLTNLPANLETLVIEDCPALGTLPDPSGAKFAHLEDLSLKGCSGLSPDAVSGLLSSARALRRFDASRCPQLRRVGADWPPELTRIDLNQCPDLKVLPERWPRGLRRLGLRGTTRLPSLPRFPAGLDYVDLAGTENLLALPEHPGRPRTLYLHNSGVLMPPASEHGESPEENVAARTHAYFEDVALVGAGEVKRCKLLVLGNGSAGKTCLSLALTGRDAKRDNPGSTHGVQFWDWQLRTVVKNLETNVDLHVWDFGGQEIYHNAHRLFMSKGAVFIVVWHPDQDKGPAPRTAGGYQDEWRPLQYWLDFIHLACPHKPQIAIVCSHRSGRTDALEQQWQAQVSERYWEECRCFYCDSWTGEGEHTALSEWLRQTVGQVVETQGVAVPSYWEIAQDMAQSWLPKPNPHEGTPPEAKPNKLPFAEFTQELEQAIEAAVRDDVEGRYAALAEARAGGRFELTEDRVKRTLGFLTHSGWLYWDETLFENYVIVGQQWALQGIYALLERREGCAIYDRLIEAHGQFTRKDLVKWSRRDRERLERKRVEGVADWPWFDRASEAEQKLLISFMLRMGVCFQLVSESESWWREPVYKSFEHLPSVGAFAKAHDQPPRSGGAQETIPCPRLHKGHWHALLKELGETYGTDAQYANDGFRVVNQERQTIFLRAYLASKRLGDRIEVRVDGPKASERLGVFTAYVTGFLPDLERREAPATEREPGRPGGEKVGQVEVFLSYTWDNANQRVPVDYEGPVDAIAEALAGEGWIKLVRDKQDLRGGDGIVPFMQRIKETDKVIVVHSDKYWRSPSCMYEFWQVVDSFADREQHRKETMILIEHHRSGFGDTKALQEYITHWESVDTMPSMLADVVTVERLRTAALHMLRNEIPKLAGYLDRNRVWRAAEKEAIICWVKGLIGPRVAGTRPRR